MWEKLTRQQIGKYAEYLAKMELTKYGLDVYTAEVDDKGIDCIVKLDDRYIDIQIKSVRNSGYIFYQKDKFILRENLYTIVVIFSFSSNLPKIFMIPSTVWIIPNKLFVSRDYAKPEQKSQPEWGINLSKKNIEKLHEYRISNTIRKLKEQS